MRFLSSFRPCHPQLLTSLFPRTSSGTDIFGLGVPNGKVLADWFAEQTGFEVFVPDFFNGCSIPLFLRRITLTRTSLAGDYVDPARLEPQPVEFDQQMKSKSVFEKIKVYVALIKALVWTVGIRYYWKHDSKHVMPPVEQVSLTFFFLPFFSSLRANSTLTVLARDSSAATLKRQRATSVSATRGGPTFPPGLLPLSN